MPRRMTRLVLLVTLIAGPAAAAEAPSALDLEQALAQARQEKKHVLLEIAAAWSPACQDLDTRIHGDPEFARFAQQHVLLRVDAGQSDEGRRLTEQFKVTAFPTVLVLDDDGDEIDRVSGYRRRPALQSELRAILADGAAFGPLLARDGESQPLSPAESLQLVRKWFERDAYDQGLRRLERLRGLAEASKDPLRLEVSYLAAQGLFGTRRYAEAIDAAQRFLAAAPADPRAAQVALLRAEALLALDRGPEAAAILRAAWDEHLGTPEAARARALLSRIPQRYDGVAQGYAARLAEANRQADAARFTAALFEVGQAMQTAALYADPHLEMARIHRRQSEQTSDPIDKSRHREKAIEALLVAQRVEPDHLAAYLEARSLLGLETLRQQAESHLDDYRTAREAGRHAEAFTALSRALAADPQHPRVWDALHGLGRAMNLPLSRRSQLVPYELHAPASDASPDNRRLFLRVSAGTLPAWREYLRLRTLWRKIRFHERHPQEKAYYLTAGEELEALQGALRYWASLKQQQPESRDEALDFLARLEAEGLLEAHVYAERFTGGFREEFESWKQKNPDALGRYLRNVLFAPAPAIRGATETASVRLGAVVENSMHRAMQAFNQATMAHRRNDLRRAIELYEATLEIDPDFAPAHQNLANIYFNQGSLVQAARHAEIGAARNPQNQGLTYLATQSYIQLQQFDEAAVVLRRAAAHPLPPETRAALLDRLAYVYIQKQEWDRAEGYLRQAAELDPDNEDIPRHLELLMEMQGKKKGG